MDRIVVFRRARNSQGAPSLPTPARDASVQGAAHAMIVRDTGYSCRGYVCPSCNAHAVRIRRRLVDLILSSFVTVNRYRCCSATCGWEGNLRLKRHPILMRGPW